MAIDPGRANNFIDSCAFDPKYDPEDKAALKIFQLQKEGKIQLIIAHSTHKEIEHPNTPDWVKEEAKELTYTLNVNLTPTEMQTLGDIERIIAGNGKIENIKEDARHIFDCQKHGAYFITTDNTLLKRREALIKRLSSIDILKPSEFLSKVKK